MGLFAISEILINAEKETKYIFKGKKVEWLPTWQDIKETWAATTRSGIVGFLFGLIPGCSPAVTSFMVYDMEKRFSKHPERFGKGAMDAVAAVEGSNNATASGGFVPLFAFGIPSGPALAVLLGGFIMYGLQPGPRLMQEQPHLLWTIIASMYIGNVILLILNLPLVGIWARMALIPFPILGSFIAVIQDFKSTGFRMGAHKAYLFGQTLVNYDVAVFSDLEPEVLRTCHLRAADPATILEEWVSGFHGTPRVAVVPNANTTYFYTKEESR